MKDVQSSPDHRDIPIDRVGVRDLRYPVKVRQQAGGYQQTIATINLYVDLHPRYRGTHMSRFVEIIDSVSGDELTVFTIPDILKEVRQKLDSTTAQIEMSFPYFLRRKAPVSGRSGMVDYQCRFWGQLDGALDFLYGVQVPVTSLCPCSKEISDRGAHNQRGLVSVDVRSRANELIWFEELIELVESKASSPVYSLLKREDEKFVTEQAYDRPVFVEDLVRNVAEALDRDDRVAWYRTEAENQESIHNHNAYALIERVK